MKKPKSKIRHLVFFLVIFALFCILLLWVGVDLNLMLLLSLFYFYLYYMRRFLAPREIKFLYLALLFLLIFTAAYFFSRSGWNFYYLPVAAVPMLSFLLFKDALVSFIFCVLLSFVVGSLAGNSYLLGMVFLIGSVGSVLTVRNARRRTEIIASGIAVGILQMLSLFFLSSFSWLRWQDYILLFLNGATCGFLTLAVLPVFEILFQEVTDISLLELTDFNHPLLRRLAQEAAGTYHHSILVGNLADAASCAIGANSLLARVGSYYHDIGKLSKPEYFSENQSFQANKHENLSPSMSKLVIMNHVKDGVELAKKHHLNFRIVDFIQQHHGTSLVYYFYRRALENLEEDEEIKEEGFRYPGPRPKSKEIAIVLLADSVEAACRCLRECSPAHIEDVVHKIINNKFIDRQLDDCDLTLKDLETIAKVFVRILSGIYHNRVIYPEVKNSEDNHKKPSESASPKDKKDN